MSNEFSKQMINQRNELSQQISEGILTKDEAIKSLAGWWLKRYEAGQVPGVSTFPNAQEQAIVNARAALEATENLDPRENNKDNFKTGQKVEVKDPTFGDETRQGFVAKQLDDRHFLIKLQMPFTRTNPKSEWLQVSRDYAHQTVKEI